MKQRTATARAAVVARQLGLPPPLKRLCLCHAVCLLVLAAALLLAANSLAAAAIVVGERVRRRGDPPRTALPADAAAAAAAALDTSLHRRIFQSASIPAALDRPRPPHLTRRGNAFSGPKPKLKSALKQPGAPPKRDKPPKVSFDANPPVVHSPPISDAEIAQRRKHWSGVKTLMEVNRQLYRLEQGLPLRVSSALVPLPPSAIRRALAPIMAPTHSPAAAGLLRRTLLAVLAAAAAAVLLAFTVLSAAPVAAAAAALPVSVLTRRAAAAAAVHHRSDTLLLGQVARHPPLTRRADNHATAPLKSALKKPGGSSAGSSSASSSSQKPAQRVRFDKEKNNQYFENSKTEEELKMQQKQTKKVDSRMKYGMLAVAFDSFRKNPKYTSEVTAQPPHQPLH
ncbi:hypothetical protein DFJ73DRAFT_779786 [Zopfochytrium polystomum]|nr:hypothetical protein DFJ73DRAFT_779786 [Zopfochytrium polystomum]